MEKVDERLESFRSKVASDLQQIIGHLNTVFGNQVELAKSHAGLDDQQAVLTRLSVSRINQIIDLQNLAFKLAIEGFEEHAPVRAEVDKHLIPTVKYDDLNKLFAELAELQKRPDFRDCLEVWYTGGDLSALPPPPVVEVKEAQQDESAPEVENESPFPEGAQIFGGDHGSESGNDAEGAPAERTADEAAHPDSVSEVPKLEDSLQDAPGDDQARPLVSNL